MVLIILDKERNIYNHSVEKIKTQNAMRCQGYTSHEKSEYDKGIGFLTNRYTY